MSGVRLDPVTGLPELPSKMFWRVTKFSTGYRYQIRIHRRLVGPISFPVPEGWGLFVTASQMVDAAYNALDRRGRHKGRGVDRALLGNYPPKRVSS